MFELVFVTYQELIHLFYVVEYTGINKLHNYFLYYFYYLWDQWCGAFCFIPNTGSFGLSFFLSLAREL